MKECCICHKDVIHRIQLPTNVGLWVCYDCFYWWQEDISEQELRNRFEKYYKESKLIDRNTGV